MIVISPHLDDAVLSCGQALAAAHGSTILTVFAGVPEGDLPLTDFDVRSGFTGARQAVETRRAEDMRAATVLGASVQHMRFLDRQYAQYVDDDEITEELVVWLNAMPDGEDVLVPVGVLHPDHRQVAVCARHALDVLGRSCVAYEELPGRVVYPTEVHISENLEVWRPSLGPLEIKEAAIACYRSQAWHLRNLWHACLVPERYWA